MYAVCKTVTMHLVQALIFQYVIFALHKHHGVSNHQQTRLFVQRIAEANNNENIKASLVKGNHWYRGLLCQKTRTVVQRKVLLVHKEWFQVCRTCVTHWGRDKMNAILQTTFSSALCRTKMFEFRLNFHCSLFLRVQLTIFQHWCR